MGIGQGQEDFGEDLMYVMSHAIKLSSFMWRNARWRNWKCGYTHLEAATINSGFLRVMESHGNLQVMEKSWESHGI